MTLHLVSDNVAKLPIGNLQDVAGMARRFADEVDQGRFGEAHRVIAFVQTPSGMTIVQWGEIASAYELMGLCEAAKLHAFADGLIGDDDG